jgi:flagellar motor switch protein FliN
MSEEILRNAARRVGEGIEAALGISLEHKAGEVQPIDEAAVKAAFGATPVAARARVGANGLALLMSARAAATLSAIMQGNDPSGGDASDDDLRQIEGLLTATLAGVDHVSAVECVRVEPSDAAAWSEFLGRDALMTEIALSAPPQVDATVTFAGALPALLELSPDGAPLVSEAEMNDILSGFGPEDEPESGNGQPLPENLDMVLGIELTATARLGRVRVPISEVLNYGPGSIIEVGHLVDEPIELLVNGKLIARGEVVVVDEKFGLRITEIVSPRERIESLR